MTHEGIGLDPEREYSPLLYDPFRAGDRALEVAGSVWVGVKAVKSCPAAERRRAGVEHRAVERVRPVERAAALERV